jgi:hypothetical protein
MDYDDDESGAFGEFGVPAYVIHKNRRQEVRIGLNEYKGVEYIDIRIFYRAEDGYRPTARGVTIPTRLYAELLQGVIDLGTLLGEIDPDSPGRGDT